MILEKRGPPRPFKWKLLAGGVVLQESLRYITPAQYMRQLRQGLRGIANRWFQMRSRSCGSPSLAQTDFENLEDPPAGGQIEHPIPVSITQLPTRAIVTDISEVVFLARYAQGSNWGRLPERRYRIAATTGPSGPRTRTPAIPNRFWQNAWRTASLPAGLPRVSPDSPDIRIPVERLYERLGSVTNPSGFVFLRDAVNAIKGRLEIFRAPMSRENIEDHVEVALAGGDRGEHAVESFMSPLREVRLLCIWCIVCRYNLHLLQTRAVFEYLNDPIVVTALDDTASGVYSDLQLIELYTEDSEG